MDTHQRRNDDTSTWIFVLVLAALAVLYRVAPYYLLSPDTHLLWNMVPIGALALFAGSRLRRNWAFLLPLAVMLVSDLLLIPALGMRVFSWGTLVIYGSFALYVLIGRLIRAGELSPLVIGGAALLAGVQFFLLTNFAVWCGGSLYPRTFAGLMDCYLAGLPFYRNTLAGDLFFSGLLFAVHALVFRPARSLQTAA